MGNSTPNFRDPSGLEADQNQKPDWSDEAQEAAGGNEDWKLPPPTPSKYAEAQKLLQQVKELGQQLDQVREKMAAADAQYHTADSTYKQWLADNAYSLGVGEALEGYFADAPKSIIAGTANMAAHPIDTLEGLANLVAHPIDSAIGIWNEFKSKLQTNRGAGEAIGEIVDNIALGKILGEVGNAVKTAKEVKDAEKVADAAKSIEKWLGDKPQVKINDSGDVIIMDAQGTKKIRFDINDPHGDQPHIHMEKKTPSGKWKDAGDQHRYYPKEK